MAENRNDDRIQFVSMGMVECKTGKLSCLLENISDGGTLIRLSDPAPERFREGDIVHLKAILLMPVELQCKVVRIDADQIAMQFIDM